MRRLNLDSGAENKILDMVGVSVKLGEMDGDDGTYMDFVRADAKARRANRMKVIAFMGLIIALVAGLIWWNWGFPARTWLGHGTFGDADLDPMRRLDIAEGVGELDNGRIHQVIFCGDGFFVFTTSNRVHAMEWGQNSYADILQTFEYDGEPHRFDFCPIKRSGP